MIDYAKTLYKPEFPEKIGNEIKKFTNEKLPAFFEYAKDKDKSQVTNRNDSLVNKLYSRIPNKTRIIVYLFFHFHINIVQAYLQLFHLYILNLKIDF